MVSLIVSEFFELEFDFFVAVGECFDDALGGGGDAGDVVGQEEFDECDGEGHLAHEVDGDGVGAVVEGEDFGKVFVGEGGDVLFVAIGVDVGEWEINDGAELLLSGSELCGVPLGAGVVGEVD